MSRRPPPNIKERYEYIVAYGLILGARVLDTALNKHAVIVGRTSMHLLKIRYEDSDVARLHGEKKLVYPTRLKPAPEWEA